MATLPELVQKFYPQLTRIFLDGVTVRTLCKPDPLRWGLIILDDATGSNNVRLWPALGDNEGFSIQSWAGRIEFNNRDHPGVPQQQWQADPNGSMGELVVFEILQVRS